MGGSSRWLLDAPSIRADALFAGLQPARQGRGDDDWIGCGALLAIELDLLDARSPLFDLFRRNENLPHVLVGLAEMLLQFQYPLVQAFEIVHEVADLGMNLVSGFPHASIFLNLLNDLDGQHQQRR